MIISNEIIIAIENNLREFYFSVNQNITVLNIFENKYLHTKNNKYDWPDFVFAEDILKSVNELEIKDLKEKQKEQKSTKIILNNFNITGNENILKRNNFQPVAKWIGMYLKTETLFKIELPDNFTIEKVETEEELKAWFNIVNGEVLKNSILKHDIFENKTEDKSFSFYLGKIEDIPVSTALIFEKDSIAGLYFISTKKEFQKKGFGNLITKFAINDCIKNNITNFVLHATKAGEKIYSKMGFTEYSKIYIFTALNS